MSTSKRIRKRKVAKYFTLFVGKSEFGRKWFYKKLIHKSDFGSLIEREVRTDRMRKKCIEFVDYLNMEPFLNRWSVPLRISNPCKKSRIKNHCDSYRVLHTDEIPSPDGMYSHTEDTLLNMYYSRINNRN